MIITMDGFDAYKTYVALKNHFSSSTYDFFKYNGRTRASVKSFEKRNDKYLFNKLSKQKNLIDFLVANIAYNENPWVGDVINNTEAEKCYKKFKKIKESITYIFQSDLEKFDPPFTESFIVKDGQHPKALLMVLEKKITLETLIILNDLSGFMKSWNRKISDTVVWPSLYLKCKKLRPFLTFDRDKLKIILVDKIKQEDYNK